MNHKLFSRESPLTRHLM
ncbi:hypothetical protein CUMW_220340 [Citrus unshiu]|uniref:Uncharacterized protein n=1 Tax=Citrus unshiu TaxID=55188 RepID=A0A2H5QDP4_CITUN|nr:hypothetical protein CUMW_220340 [Citrus unshiu]